jgi:3-oxoacyl-[acyl-carrier-protein] synthase-1
VETTVGIIMIVRIGDNIISSLGFTTEENYRSVKSGRSGLAHYQDCMGVPEAFVASLIDKERLSDAFAVVCPYSENHTPLEKAAILSVANANEEAQIDLASPRVLFVFSSTKGNVHLLDKNEKGADRNHLYLWYSARLIAEYFNNPNTPLVISNACISGAAAQIAAMRELESGRYDYAVVTGVDFLSKFIIAGFQSFKALSPEPCRPFDANRSGLNLGEAAATIIYSCHCGLDPQSPNQLGIPAFAGMTLVSGVIRNDANHISGPSRTGEGSFRALQSVLQNVDKQEIAFINAHGTATPYNDAMESVAIQRAELESVPVNSLKGFFGHTLGAAGVLESIISMRALTDKTALATQGFEKNASDCSIHVNAKNQPIEKPYCLKMLSGFGGVNAALLFEAHR